MGKNGILVIEYKNKIRTVIRAAENSIESLSVLSSFEMYCAGQYD